MHTVYFIKQLLNHLLLHSFQDVGTLYMKYKYKRSRARTKYELLGIKIRVFNAKSHCFATLQIEVRKAVMSEVFPSPCLSASVLCVCS